MQDIFSRCIDINCRVGSLEKQGQLHKGLCHHAAVPISLSFAEKTFKMHLNMKATGNNVIWNASRKISSNRISSLISPIIGLRRKKKRRNTACWNRRKKSRCGKPWTDWMKHSGRSSSRITYTTRPTITFRKNTASKKAKSAALSNGDWMYCDVC